MLPSLSRLNSPTGASDTGVTISTFEGPGAVRADRKESGTTTHKLQLDLFNNSVHIDFATTYPSGLVQWFGGASAVREHLEANITERSIFKTLAARILGDKLGPEFARTALSEFTDGLSPCGCASTR
tara:strand:+ start:5280 stop:5660 length:381 start_codon:yes stop_codon:yes gene_type:complete